MSNGTRAVSMRQLHIQKQNLNEDEILRQEQENLSPRFKETYNFMQTDKGNEMKDYIPAVTPIFQKQMN